VNAVVNGLSPQQRLIGVALVAVGVLGLLGIAVRRLLLGRRRKPAPLPSPRMPPRQR
jgi:hypothetical protein